MKRIDALHTIVAHTSDCPVVATCAATSRELAFVADRDNHLYLLDAMGLAVSVSTGLAQAIEGTSLARSVCIEGDGSLLMNLGAAATAGFLAPRNLVVFLLDNGVYASTAGIATQAARLDLGVVAEAVGMRVLRADDAASLETAASRALAEPGPWFIHVRIEPGNTAGVPLLLIDPVSHGDRFRWWVLERSE